MNYKKISKSNYDIYYIKDDKFKTNYISTAFINDYDDKDISKEKVISSLLVNSTKEYNTEVLMNKKIMELYKPLIDIYDVFKDKHTRWIDITFLDEKYTEQGMNKKTIDFYYSLVFKPNVNNNSFNIDNLNIIKKSLLASIKLQKENPSYLSFRYACKNISGNSPLKKDLFLKSSYIRKYTPEELYQYYKKLIKKSKVVVFVIGNNVDEIIKAIEDNLDKKVYKNEYEIIKNFEVSKVIKPRTIIKETDFNQSIVYIFYKLMNLTNREKNVVLPIFNYILGGSSSKLFNNVREKNSLAYYVYSDFYDIENILYLTAGIQKSNFEKTVELMKEQVEEMKNGNITEMEINNSKEFFVSKLLAVDDSFYMKISNLVGHIAYDRILYDEKEKEFLSVTKDEIITLANKLDLDFVYLFGGVS